jgi:hypothetical protein
VIANAPKLEPIIQLGSAGLALAHDKLHDPGLLKNAGDFLWHLVEWHQSADYEPFRTRLVADRVPLLLQGSDVVEIVLPPR